MINQLELKLQILETDAGLIIILHQKFKQDNTDHLKY